MRRYAIITDIKQMADELRRARSRILEIEDAYRQLQVQFHNYRVQSELDDAKGTGRQVHRTCRPVRYAAGLASAARRQRVAVRCAPACEGTRGPRYSEQSGS